MPEKASETPESPERGLPVLGERYAVTERIGKGGAAGVYLVFDQNLARWRAAKVLHRRYANHAELRARFLREARTMARLDHPNIVRVLDVADVEVPYMIMEYVEGGCVLDWLRVHGTMPAFMAVQVMIDVCKALRATHDEGLVHRDVKPHNVLVTSRGQCKLTDYGIAKVDPTEAGFVPDEHRTAVGATMGTDAFMAPEQRSDASSVDHRADIYSVGATLYTLCARKAAVDLCMLAPDHPKLQVIPPALREILLKACHHRAEQRYQRVEELEEALSAVLYSLPPVPEGTPPLARVTRELPRRPQLDATEIDHHDLRDLLTSEATTEPDDDADFTLGGPSDPEPTPQPPPAAEPATTTPPPEPPPPEVEPSEPAPPLSPAMMAAIAVVVVVVLAGGGAFAAARTGAAAVHGARVEAQGAWVAYHDALTREHGLVAALIRAGAERGPLEQAWFTLQDARPEDQPEAAERYWRAVEAAAGRVDAAGARPTLESLAAARAQWQQADSAWHAAAGSATGSLAVMLGMAERP